MWPTPASPSGMLASLRAHGSTDAWIVHGGGLDELTTTGPSTVLALAHDGTRRDVRGRSRRPRLRPGDPRAARRGRSAAQRRRRATRARRRARSAPRHRRAQRGSRPRGGGRRRRRWAMASSWPRRRSTAARPPPRSTRGSRRPEQQRNEGSAYQRRVPISGRDSTPSASPSISMPRLEPSTRRAMRRRGQSRSTSTTRRRSPSRRPAVSASCGCVRRFRSVVVWDSAGRCGSAVRQWRRPAERS